MEFVKDYGPNLVLGVLQLLLVWASWSMRRAFVTKPELAAVIADATKLSGRVDGIERDIKHMPTKDELHALQLELAEAVGEIKLARAEYASMMNLMTRVEEAVTRHEQIFVDAARAR
jgi:hypothetical protein